VVTDGWGPYRGAVAGCVHQPINISASGSQAHVSLPGVHRVAALLKRWLLGTHQGGVEPDHLAAHLDEFVFRFNLRRSEARGLLFRRLLEQAVSAPPMPYRQLVVNPGEEAYKAHRAYLAAGTAQPGPQPAALTLADRRVSFRQPRIASTNHAVVSHSIAVGTWWS